jgi:hypothetical protein
MRTILLLVVMGLIAGCQSTQVLGEMADSVSNAADRGTERAILCVTRYQSAPEGYHC